MSKAIPWLEDVHDIPKSSKIDRNYSVDVVVVGGGIAGLMTAYHLVKEGKQVALFEKGKLVSGETGFTTGFITQVSDYSLPEIQKVWGDAIAKEVWSSGKDIITTIERIIKDEEIECEFMRVPAFIFANDEKGFNSLQEEASKASEYGFTEVKLKPDNDLPFPNSGVMVVDNQAKWHVGKFLIELAKKITDYGGLIFEGTTIDDISGNSPVTAKAGEYTITCEYAVVDTNNPFTFVPEVHERVVPYITYVSLYEIEDSNLQEGIYWDTDEPYHYFRIDKKDSQTLLMLGGEDHKSGNTPTNDPYAALDEYFNKKFPNTPHKRLVTWSGEVLESIDGLPFIGATLLNKKILVSSGFAGNGMTFGPISAVVNRDIILNKENPLIEVYKLSRFGNVKEFIKHGAAVAKDVASKFFSSSKDSELNDIAPGEGNIVKIDGKRFAIYKNEEGTVKKLSPYCTHQKCLVGWNTNDKTWDCPCHGSRFAKDGKVITGPAVEDLPVIEN